MRILYWDNGRSDNPLDSFMGVVGCSTDLTDSCGNPLCVGDIVISVDGTLNIVSVDVVVWEDQRIVRYSRPGENVDPYIIGLKGAKFAKINCSLADFLGISEDDLFYETEDDILNKIHNSADKQKFNGDLWYNTLAKKGVNVDDGHCVPTWNRLKYATINDKEYYGRLNNFV